MGGCMDKKAQQRTSRSQDPHQTDNPNEELSVSPTRLKARQRKSRETQLNDGQSPMSTMQLDKVRDSTINIQDEQDEESCSLKYYRPNRGNTFDLKLPNPQAESYHRSQTVSSNVRSGLRHEDSLNHIDPKKHRCLVKRPSYLENSDRMEEMEKSSNVSYLMGSNMRLKFTCSSSSNKKSLIKNNVI